MIHFITDFLYPTLLVLFFFEICIFIHEYGHYRAARRRGLKVERFSLIGFGPKLVSWRRNDIEYCICWIPFGAYVVIPQLVTAEALEGKTEKKSEELPPASPRAKIAVAFAGPLFNFLLAVLIALLIWVVGLPMLVNPSVVGWVEPGSAEEKLGIQPGDRIVQINGREVKTWEQILIAVVTSRESQVRVALEHDGQRREVMLESKVIPQVGVKTINLYPEGRPFVREVLSDSPAEKAGVRADDKFLSVGGVPVTRTQQLIELISKRANQPTELRVLRDGKVVTLTAIPRLEGRVGRIGVSLGEQMEYEVMRPGPMPQQQFAEVLGLMGNTFYALLHHKETGVGPSSLSGPVGIVGGLWHEIVHGGVRRGLWFALLLNINLAILNLLPIPVLDGGHILFALVEAVRRKPLNTRFVHAAWTVFAVLLISFMLYVTFFDIRRLTAGRLRPVKPPPAEQAPAPAKQTP